MTITALPTPPLRSDPANFSARGDTFLAALPVFVTEANALEVNVTAKEASATASAATATTKAANALASETAAADSASTSAAAAAAGLWITGTTYAVGNTVWSPITKTSYRRIVAGAGTTDPSSDTTNWATVIVVPINPTFARTTLSVATGSIDWDFDLGQMAIVTLNGNKTFNMPTNLKMAPYILFVKNDPATARTIAWNAGIIWPGNMPPDLGGINSLTLVSFVCDGVNLYGSYTPGY